MKKGDIVKLGRIKFKVKDMRTETEPSYLDYSNNKTLKNSKYSPSPDKSRKNQKKNFELNQQFEDDYSLGSDDISDEFIEIDCAVID